MDAYVRLTDLYGNPVFLKTKSIESVYVLGTNTEVLTSGSDSLKYIVEETPAAVIKLMTEAEVANVLKVDEIEDERCQRAREVANGNE